MIMMLSDDRCVKETGNKLDLECHGCVGVLSANFEISFRLDAYMLIKNTIFPHC